MSLGKKTLNHMVEAQSRVIAEQEQTILSLRSQLACERLKSRKRAAKHRTPSAARRPPPTRRPKASRRSPNSGT